MTTIRSPEPIVPTSGVTGSVVPVVGVGSVVVGVVVSDMTGPVVLLGLGEPAPPLSPKPPPLSPRLPSPAGAPPGTVTSSGSGGGGLHPPQMNGLSENIIIEFLSWL